MRSAALWCSGAVLPFAEAWHRSGRRAGPAAALAAIGLAGLAAAAAPAAGPSAPSAPAPGGAATANDAAAPVIARADVLVVDSSLVGCVLAGRIAAQGRRVVLASAGTSLPREMTTCLRPWADEKALAGLPQDLARILGACVRDRAGGEAIFAAARLAQALEDMVLDAGVALYYDVHPCGVVRGGRRVAGVIFAGKAGLVAVEAAAVVDCTPDAALALLAGAEAADREAATAGRLQVSYAMLCEAAPPQKTLTAKGRMEVPDVEVVAHGPFAEFRMRLPAGSGPLAGSATGVDTRRAARLAALALRQSGTWKDAAFARGGDRVVIEPTRRIACRAEGDGAGKLTLDACRPRGIDNVLVCGPAADVGDAMARDLLDPLKGLALADAVAGADWAALCTGGEGEGPASVRLTPAEAPPGAEAAGLVRLDAVEPICRTEAAIPLGGVRPPVVATCDVLVVGGGTSGVPAALAAARSGSRTILLEKHGDVGGTQTIGGVSKYWFGRPTAFVDGLDKEAGASQRASGMPRCTALLGLLGEAGVHVATHCSAVGTIVEGGRVVGVVAATPEGLVAVRARCTIDATGDGDVAARAGAACTWGTARDALALWYSFGTFVGARPEASRNFDSSVDLRDPADLTRAMIVSRRRKGIFGEGDFPQAYLAPRESRHVRGRATVTYGDILAGRRRRDVVAVAQSNFDIKGIADSDLAQCGYAEPEFGRNYVARIPYGALLPEKLEGILVVGKAFSITHDALALARMQKDLMALGAAAGLAAAMACEAGTPPSGVDVPLLQKGLVELGVLTEADLADLPRGEADELPAMSEDELRRLVAELASGKPTLADEGALLARGERALPPLRRALPDAPPDGRLRIARALCFLGDAAGADAVLAALADRLGSPSLPQSPQKRHTAPDHGYAPEPAFLINLLGRLGERRVVPLLAPLARRVHMNPARSDDMFQYVFAVCYASERLGDPACVEALTILADKEGIRGGALPRGTDPRKSLSVPAERYAYLELCVGRAMARCGSRRGYGILIDYLADVRGFLARSAHEELTELAGEDFGYAVEKWRSWLAAAADPSPRPYRKRIE